MMDISCRLLLFCVLIFNVSDSLEVNTREGKITGGREARPHSNPYVVSLQTRFLWLRYRLCTGSILSQRWILSAGHCVTDSWARWLAMDAIVGAHNLASISYSQIYPISHRIAHPMYRGGVGPYDIAMMRTSRNITFSETVQPIRLPRINPMFKENENLLITGWGALRSNVFVTELPNKLQEAKVTYLPYLECYRAVDKIKDWYEANPLKKIANICTGPISGGIAGCTGDSGGPLVRYMPYTSGNITTPSETTTDKDEITTDKDETTTVMSSTMRPTPMTTDRTSTATTTRTTSPTPMTTGYPSTTTNYPSTTKATNYAETTTAATFTTEAIAMEDDTTSPLRDILRYKRSTSETNYEENNERSNDNLRALKTDMIPTVVGVMSWGVVPCGKRGAPTVYSNVTNYLDFINKYLYSY